MPRLLRSVRKLLRRSSWEKYDKSGAQNPLYVDDRYAILSLLASGADGDVYNGIDSLTGASVAIKRLKRSPEDCAAEVVISNCLGRSCSRCLPTMDCYEDEGATHIVSPFMANGDLFDYIFSSGQATNGINLDTALTYFAQTALGLMEIHNMGFVHGDLKLENLLVDDRGQVKIGDFGRARKYGENQKTLFQGGTLMYSAPESLQGIAIQGPEMDVWSLGVCLYVMLSGYFPFGGNTPERVKESICFRGVHQMTRQRPVPADVERLIEAMLCKSATKRIKLSEVLEHSLVSPYVKYVQSTSFNCK